MISKQGHTRHESSKNPGTNHNQPIRISREPSLAASAAIFAAWIGVQRAVPWVTTLSCLGHQALQGGPRKPVLNGVTWVAL